MDPITIALLLAAGYFVVRKKPSAVAPPSLFTPSSPVIDSDSPILPPATAPTHGANPPILPTPLPVPLAPVVAGEGSVSATGPQAGGGIVLGPPVYGGGAMPTNAGLSTDLNRWIRSL